MQVSVFGISLHRRSKDTTRSARCSSARVLEVPSRPRAPAWYAHLTRHILPLHPIAHLLCTRRQRPRRPPGSCRLVPQPEVEVRYASPPSSLPPAPALAFGSRKGSRVGRCSFEPTRPLARMHVRPHTRPPAMRAASPACPISHNSRRFCGSHFVSQCAEGARSSS